MIKIERENLFVFNIDLVSLPEVAAGLNKSNTKCVVFEDRAGNFVGIMQDGDLRRSILSGCHSVAEAVNRNSLNASAEASVADLREVALKTGSPFVPIVSKAGRFEYLIRLSVESTYSLPNTAFIMAGGKGTRLKKYTLGTPKPMLPIQGVPTLVYLINHLRDDGIRRIILSVNYLAEHIVSFFGDGSSFGVEIEYVFEKKPLGTAGSVAFVKNSLEHPLLVINGDILCDFDFKGFLYDFSVRNLSISVACRLVQQEFAFGVIRSCESTGLILGIDEKPKIQFGVASGIYILSPEVVADLKEGRKRDMPDFINSQVKKGVSVGRFVFDGAWVDMGTISEYEALK